MIHFKMFKTRTALLTIFAFVLFFAVSGQAQAGNGGGARGPAGRTFGWKGSDFLLDGKPFIVRSGEMHYPRVPRAYWRDRFRKAKAMGLNTLTTYVFWSLHEPKRGQFDFTGNLDIAEFVREAKEEGLFVIVRPGPYICTEWEFGGIPAWLLAEPDMKVRTSDDRFMEAAGKYLIEVGKQLAPLEIANGGNILMVQVENEYGSFGKDNEYIAAVRDMIRTAGFSGQLFTSDGSLDYMLQNGTLPDALSVINFDSSDDPMKEFANFAKFRQGVPRMTGEYWIGWFDHWGEKRHTVNPEIVARGVDTMLRSGISFNLYMFHGGTTFGFMNGANYSSKEPFQPDTSSYDYDSPLDEAGRPTTKYFAIRDVIRKYLPPGEVLPEVPVSAELIEIPAFELEQSADLLSLLGKPTSSVSPLSMEQVGQNYGFVLYRTKLERDLSGVLMIEARDYAHVFVNGSLIGKLDRRKGESSIAVDARAGSILEILVENGGRLNFGKDFIFDRKGINGRVTLDGTAIENWQIFSLPLDDLSRLKFRRNTKPGPGPTFYRGSFKLHTLGDTYLDTTMWGKGHVWVNGHHLGRYWKIGPQQTLFVPAGFLKKGKNEVIVLETDTPRKTTLMGVKAQIFGNQ